MKFSTAALFVASMGVASAEFSLRSWTKTSAADPTNAEVRVSIHGLKEDVSAEDMEIINASIKKAYNRAYKNTGYSMNSFEAKLSSPVPDNVSWDPFCRLCRNDDDSTAASATTEGQMFLGEVNVSWDPFCRLCRNDDDATASQLGDVHSSFENKFCASLRTSGSKNLAHARDCTFSFLDMPGKADENLPTQDMDKMMSGKKAETQLTMQGTLHDFSEKDMELIDQSVLSAYNEAFASAGYKLESFVSTAELDLPAKLSWDPFCRLCRNDDDALLGDSKMVISSATSLEWDPFCRLCRNDDDAVKGAAPISEQKLGYLQKSFEKALCTKLQNSGSANFANVHDCSFRFVYAPVAETTAQS